MRVYVIALVCVFAVMVELAAASYHSLAWRHYKKQHGKVYEPEEDAMRFANFLATKQRVERHNANPNASFKMGLNHMADWSSEERKQLTNLKVDASKLKRTPLSANLRELMDKPAPKKVDWRKQGRVTAVKNQKNCGSCWSFSTTGLLEGQQAKRNMSKLVPLSEQFLCDCSPNNNGCGGGLMDRALEDIAYLGGIQSEQDYPYEAVDNACRFDAKKYVMTVKGATLLGQGDEEALFKAVANYGPVSVAICVTQTFLDYDNGVLDDQTCSPQSLNHGVLVVGYGTDSQYGDYWIVKNSWSANWGERGYIRMKRGVNQCGIAEYATLADF